MRRFIFIIFSFWIYQAIAQEPAYLHYGINDGLPSALVYCSLQDRQGMFWFGTDKGLARFDGTRFRVYTMKDGLPDPEVINMFEDSQGRLWLSCFLKKPCYFQNGRFVTEQQDSSLRAIKISGGTFTFFEDNTGAIWIAERSTNFCRYSPSGTTSFKAPFTIYKIDTVGSEFFAFGTLGIFKIQENGKLESVYNVSPSFLSISPAGYNKMMADFNKGIPSASPTLALSFHVSMASFGRRAMYGFPQGVILAEYDEKQFREVDRLPGTIVTHTATDRSGRFWALSQTTGALRFDHDQSLLRKHQVLLPGKKPSHVFEDKEGTIWFGTLNDGVYALTKNQVITHSSKSEKHIFKSDNFTALSRLTNGVLVAGDDSGNLYFYDNGEWRIKPLGSVDGYNQVRKILPLPDGQWLAISDESIVSSSSGRLNINRGEGAYKTVFKGPDAIWLGTSNYLLQLEEGPEASEAQIILRERITSIGQDAENNLWVGGRNGLLSQKDSFQTLWKEKFPEIDGRIITIQQAGKNSIWVVTPNHGLLRVFVKEGAVTKVEGISEKLTKPVNDIKSIFAEDNGRVWLAANTGVYAITKDMTMLHFSREDGLANDDVNDVLVYGDTLWAATVSGLSRLLLRQPGEAGHFPTLITGFRYRTGDRKIYTDIFDHHKKTEEFTIPAGASLLEIEMSGLHYTGHGNLQYELVTTEFLLPFTHLTWRNLNNWMLNGFSNKSDTTVIETAVRNFGLNIPAGKYRIKTTAILPGGARSISPDERTFKVLPHWTNTVWFSLLVLGITAAGIWQYYLTGQAIRQMKSETSELKLQAVKAQINPHFIGNSINAIQQFLYPPDPVKASQYIAIFSDLLRRTMFFSEHNFIFFKDELSYIRAYLEMISLRYGERFQYSIQGEKEIPPDMPVPAMILQPVLENATIHGMAPEGNSRLKIEFYFQKDRFFCLITDNGVGIDASKEQKKINGSRRPSRGLLLLEKKTQMLNRLQPFQLQVNILSLNGKNNGPRGTQVSISFLPEKIRQSKIYSYPVN